MSSIFITNQNDLLSEVMNNILPTTEKLHFLVGYFYFSGFEEIYKSLEDKHLRVLVGLDIERDISNKIKEYELLESMNYSRGKIRENYNQSLIELFNDTDFFDSAKKQDAFRSFLGKIKNGTLEIKKTLDPNHAKLYLFEKKPEHSEGGNYPGVLITGSSNLSVSGLKNRYEINVAIREKTYFEEGRRIFDELWKAAVDIVTKDSANDFFSSVIENIWIDKLYRPYLLYVRVLTEYFMIDSGKDIKLPHEITNGGYLNLKYQTDSVRQALAIINRHGGVILSDVVGLGKSIIASALAHNLRMKTIIVAPPHLKRQWEDFRYQFDYNAKVFSSGKIVDALQEKIYDEEMLIIIDEAHKYRNELTDDYAGLHRLCQGNKVVLLSATPFNNRPEDIFSMIKLFQIPAKSTIQTVDNLALRFRELILEYRSIQKDRRLKKDIADLKRRINLVAEQIRDILSPLIIRRSRLDLIKIKEYKDDLDKQNITFPDVSDPVLLEYDLGDLTDLYEETLETLCPEEEDMGFIGARYKPSNYLKDFDKYKARIAEEFGDENLFRQSQRNLALFMKHLLVRRFESSIDAFRHTLDSMIASSQKIKDWYDKMGRVPIYKKGNFPDVDTLIESAGEEMEVELSNLDFDDELDALIDKKLDKFYEKGLQFIEKEELTASFIKHVESDISLLGEIKEKWFNSSVVRNDPKLESLIKVVKEKRDENDKRKIIIFSEFADTAYYLHENLKNDFRTLFYSASESSETIKTTIKENFDAGSLKQSNEYDILIATDAISEGYNLHRAGVIFNYDIPFNPTRVIQRVGRINRINKKVFDRLFIFNFFPTATGERETSTRAISTLKISMIHSLLGEDTKVLTPDEEPVSFYHKTYNRVKNEFISKFRGEVDDGDVSWDVEHRNSYNDLKTLHPDIIKEAQSLPKRVRLRRTVEKDKSGVIVFGKKGDEYTFKLGIDDKTTISLSARESLSLFQSNVTEKSTQVSANFERIYQNVKKNLFIRKSEIPKEKGKKESIDKIRVLLSLFPEKKDYFEDLLKVVSEYDALPEKYLKDIRAVSEKNIKTDTAFFENLVSHRYLVEILEKARKIDEGVESLILSEELI